MPTAEFLRCYFVASLGWDPSLVLFMWESWSGLQRSCAVAESYRAMLHEKLPGMVEGLDCAQTLQDSLKTGPSVIGFDIPVVELAYYEVVHSRAERMPQLLRTCFGIQNIVSGRKELKKYLRYDIARMELHSAVVSIAALDPTSIITCAVTDEPLGRSQLYCRGHLLIKALGFKDDASHIITTYNSGDCALSCDIGVVLGIGLRTEWRFDMKFKPESPELRSPELDPNRPRSARWATSALKRLVDFLCSKSQPPT
jgi:hypothetical protein